MIAQRLAQAIAAGIRQIGQISILPDASGSGYSLCHIEDLDHLDTLTVHHGPDPAREISTWAEDGHYRFTKGELSLRRGWLLKLADAAELRAALDLFYPASVGLWLAHEDGRIDVQTLRDKLNRQTGMYRFARNLSNEGAQRLVREVCGPGNCCVKKILWDIQEGVPLEPSETSRWPGYLDTGTPAIPLYCREACNHFVAEARKASKAEFEARSS
ncbi:MAG: hypothetical protein MUF31_05140 [Akkermansiaceae bacterium]|jgi:sirohydrochlorin cobaltochelatase|nr:hypothetical protein [Akkermansiaceae bacterium]